ncbi:hypothetical protein GCM10011378_11630 [Hymenobacter glacieicola]|uniref:Uncharacterized protein n=2 Tax=Hymenobacter glacieicola TaxID=1562124 RepID=A0ABQ1WMT4_9BACT|nr:hypothetical protein GCM10011378_11630 [Hymenobacter glacieicola]
MAAYVAFALTDSLYLEGFDKLNSYTNAVESFLCISFIFLYFEYFLLKGKLNSPTRNPVFITNCAILIYMTSTVGIYLFLNNFIAQNDADAVYRIYFINLVMLLFLSITLARAFWLVGPVATPADRYCIS